MITSVLMDVLCISVVFSFLSWSFRFYFYFYRPPAKLPTARVLYIGALRVCVILSCVFSVPLSPFFSSPPTVSIPFIRPCSLYVARKIMAHDARRRICPDKLPKVLLANYYITEQCNVPARLYPLVCIKTQCSALSMEVVSITSLRRQTFA